MTIPSVEPHFFISGPVGRLETVLEPPASPLSSENPIVVMCHPHPLMGGNMDHKVVTTVCKAFNQLGFLSVRFNYRGVGQSEGVYGNMVGEGQDLEAVVAWIRQAYPGCRLWLAGFSFGSFITYQQATRLGAEQLLSIAPVVHPDTYPSMDNPTMPWTIIVAGADEIAHSKETFEWLETVKVSYRLFRLSEASHFFHGQLTRLKDLIVREYAPELRLSV